jgi:hypothetical protein
MYPCSLLLLSFSTWAATIGSAFSVDKEAASLRLVYYSLAHVLQPPGLCSVQSHPSPLSEAAYNNAPEFQMSWQHVLLRISFAEDPCQLW